MIRRASQYPYPNQTFHILKSAGAVFGILLCALPLSLSAKTPDPNEAEYRASNRVQPAEPIQVKQRPFFETRLQNQPPRHYTFAPVVTTALAGQPDPNTDPKAYGGSDHAPASQSAPIRSPVPDASALALTAVGAGGLAWRLSSRRRAAR